MSLKEQWIEALRSGKYQQGQKTLRTYDDKFCCLGVLCDIVDNTAWIKNVNRSCYGHGTITRTAHIDENIWEKLSKYFTRPELQSTFMEFNDIEGKSFAEIADWIEANL